MIFIQLAIVLLMILVGARMKGIGLGVMGMLGLLIFILVFHMRPADPPFAVMLIIMAIVTTAATLQAAGGLDFLVRVAEKIIRKNPSHITFIAPFTTYFLCLFAGTAHLVYSMLPIIAEVAAKKRIRPERPLSITVIASHLSLTGSPMSAATAALAALLADSGGAMTIMMICIPSCLVGIFAGALFMRNRGKELDEDPGFLELMKNPEFARSLEKDSEGAAPLKPGAKTAVLIFGIAILLIVLFGSVPALVPNVGAGAPSFSVTENGNLSMSSLITIITLSAAGVIMLVTKTKPTEVSKASLFTSMATAVVSVFGVVWMSATFMAANEPLIKHALSDVATLYPWTFSFALFIMGALTFSQAATTQTMMPLGLTLGITHPHLLAMFPSVNGDFLLPGYPTLVAAIDFDRTGTTRVGKFLVNHSFLLPGLIAVVVAVCTGFILSGIFL